MTYPERFPPFRVDAARGGDVGGCGCAATTRAAGPILRGAPAATGRAGGPGPARGGPCADARSSSVRPDSPRNLRLDGFVLEGTPGAKLAFQEYIGHAWKAIATVSLNRNMGGHTWVRMPKKKTTLAFRSYIPAAAGKLASSSAVLHVKVE